MDSEAKLETPNKRMKLSLKYSRLKSNSKIINNSETRSTTVSTDVPLQVKDTQSVEMLKIPETRRIGYVNLQNTCFINSILYILASTTEFTEKIHKISSSMEKMNHKDKLPSKFQLVIQLHEVFKSLHEANDGKLDERGMKHCMQSFLEKLRTVNPMYEGSSQQDAHEFLNNLLHYIEDATKAFNNELPAQKTGKKSKCRNSRSRVISRKKKRLKNEMDGVDRNSTVLPLFSGEVHLKTRCLECESTTESVQSFVDIDVSWDKENHRVCSADDISEDEESDDRKVSAALLLPSLTKEDGKLYGDDKFWCERCMQNNEASRSKFYGRLPTILTFFIKRFSKGISSFKVMDSVEIPTELKYETGPDETTKYRLYGMVVHTGISLTSGHYTTFVKQSTDDISLKNCCQISRQNWFFCDDEKIKEVSSDQIEQISSGSSPLTVYLIFYHRS